jgi:hypothetical protein
MRDTSKIILDILQRLEVKDPVDEAFEKAKLIYVSDLDLGKGRAAARTTITKTAPGNDEVLKALLAAWDAENPPTGNVTPLPAGKQIPAQTLNLDSPNITIDDVTYKIPSQITMTANAKNPPDPHSLSTAEWVTLATNKFLTRGIDMSVVIDFETGGGLI